MSVFDKETLRKSGKVVCGDCQHFEPGKTTVGVGFCGTTKNRQIRVNETGKMINAPTSSNPSFQGWVKRRGTFEPSMGEKVPAVSVADEARGSLVLPAQATAGA